MQRLPVLGAVLVIAAACQDVTSPNPIAAPTRANAAKEAAANDYIVALLDDQGIVGGLFPGVFHTAPLHLGRGHHMTLLKAADDLNDGRIARSRKDHRQREACAPV